MIKSAVALFLIALVSGASALALEATGTFGEAKILAAQQNKPLLVDFFATW